MLLVDLTDRVLLWPWWPWTHQRAWNRLQHGSRGKELTFWRKTCCLETATQQIQWYVPNKNTQKTAFCFHLMLSFCPKCVWNCKTWRSCLGSLVISWIIVCFRNDFHVLPLSDQQPRAAFRPKPADEQPSHHLPEVRLHRDAGHQRWGEPSSSPFVPRPSWRRLFCCPVVLVGSGSVFCSQLVCLQMSIASTAPGCAWSSSPASQRCERLHFQCIRPPSVWAAFFSPLWF